MIVGSYTLELYCDAPASDPLHARYQGCDGQAEYTAETGAACRRQARIAGWKLKRDGTCVCPQCRKEA